MKRISNQGFTLIEVMVAIGMFAIISLAATQMLRTIVTSHELTEKRVEFFSGLTRAVSILERDFSQTLPRQVKDEYGSPRPAVIIGGGDYITEFTRAGWNNPLGRVRSNVQRVAYSMNEEGELIRHFWKVLDRAEDSEPVDQILMTGVKSFRLTALNKDGETVEAWPDQNTGDPMPLAVEVFLETEILGEIRRVFVLPKLAIVTKPPGGSNNNNSNNNNSNNNNSNNNNTNNGGQNFDPDL